MDIGTLKKLYDLKMLLSVVDGADSHLIEDSAEGTGCG
jgi:hypothetical protein